MLRAALCILIALSALWVRPAPSDACGVKMSIKSPRMTRTLAARRTLATPRRTLVARRPIRVGPSSRSPVATGSSNTGDNRDVAASNESAQPATQAPASDTATDESTTDKTRVAAIDKTAPATDTAPAAEPEPTAAEPGPTPRSFHARIPFGQSTAELTSQAKALLTRDARWWKRHGANKQLTVEGHCSATGPAEPNQILSEVRARVVKEFLVEQGVDESKIETVGLGFTKPDHKPATSAKNRRVVIRVSR
jgi:outer membrane protein OmpA-like peptidoglycan-associated protein